jgi:ADP-heptose:LPS heptosyltransferase
MIMAPPNKPKLLVLELWGMGDLVVTTPFLRAASELFEITLLAKPIAVDLQPRLWPGVEIMPFIAPWTAFAGKYQLQKWPWTKLAALVRELAKRRFDIAASGRWDPRDHAVLAFTGARQRVGLPRLGSGIFLTDRLSLPPPDAHRYENWRTLGRHFALELPTRPAPPALKQGQNTIVVHTGAAQPARIWPLDRFLHVITQLRNTGRKVEIVCDASQRSWWLDHGETPCTPSALAELMDILDHAAIFIGNDSGPGHLAAILGVPTFTIFGNQFPARFSPLHPAAEWCEGDPCPYKPCYDSCRYLQPNCLLGVRADSAWLKLKTFVDKQMG